MIFLRLTLFGLLMASSFSYQAQFFDMKKPYTGSHYAFNKFDPVGINQFVVGFNDMWKDDLLTGFSQYDGGELGQTYTTSGFRVIFGNNEERKWTISTDYAYGGGKNKNYATFSNGIEQELIMRYRSNQITQTFGISLKENTIWLEGMYCTNLSKVIIEYSTIHKDGNQSFGSEYRLNGMYTGKVKTMEFGIQMSYKYKKYVLYGRALMPVAMIGPGEDERNFIDERSSREAPNDFPSNYEAYVNAGGAYSSGSDALQSSFFKGFSYGFGVFYYMGKE